MANIEHWSICNLAFALIKEDGTYDTPVKHPGAVNLAITPNDSANNQDAADGGLYYDGSGAGTKTGELEVALFSPWFKEKILGHISEGGGFGEGDGAKSRFAMLFETDGDGGGDRYVWYDCSSSDINVTFATTDVDGNVTFGHETATITAKMTTLPNGNKRRAWYCEKGSENYANFYEAVYFPTTSDTPGDGD